MDEHPPLPILTVYRRADCELCDEARLTLQALLEERAAAGLRLAAVRERDVAEDADLEERYGELVPVFRLGEAELPLAIASSAIRRFLAEALDQAPDQALI
jgi:hypothetical protein